MRTIHKHILPITDVVTLDLHVGAQVLSVGLQRGVLCLWALENTDLELDKRRFFIIGTGHLAPGTAIAEHIGTVIDETLGLVWHVFEEIHD